MNRRPNALGTLLSSSETYSAIGNFLVSMNTWSGTILHPVLGLLAVANQHRRRCGLVDGTNSRGSLLDLLREPGVYRKALAITFIASAVEAVSQGRYAQATAFVMMVIANLAAARLLNREHARAEEDVSLKPGLLQGVWHAVPARARSVLVNPAPAWCVADVIIGVMDLQAGQISSPWFAIPAVLAAAGFFLGVAPAFGSSRFKEPTSISLAVSASANISMGIANLLVGSTGNGCALLLWGTSTYLLSMIQRRKTLSISS